MAKLARRVFFARAIAGIAGLIGLGLSIPLLGYAILPALRRREALWSAAGSVANLEIDRPKQFEIVRSSTSGWMKTNSVRSIWAFRKAGGEEGGEGGTEGGQIVAYSPICPHLGCAYRWEDEERKFFCPCHNSIFDLSGRVLGGPAPRPLDTLPTKTEDGRLFVRYQEFKVGILAKEEI